MDAKIHIFTKKNKKQRETTSLTQETRLFPTSFRTFAK